ncbi:MAG: Mov34/MPN/PAD-1 family protein [Bacteroidia bacterium]
MAKFIIRKAEKINPIKEVFSIKEEEVLFNTLFVEKKEPFTCLAFLPKQFENLFSHIGWGKETIGNQAEQGGLLAGHIYYVKHEQATYGLVKQIIPAYSADSSMKHLHFSHQTWLEMMQKLEEDGYTLIGWYHTHPKHLRVYMSETDMQTQSTLFYEDWHFSVILNPQQKIWRVFHGKKATECLGIVTTLTIQENEKII